LRKPSQTIPRNLGGRGARQAEQRLALAAETVKTADQQRDLERQRAEELDRLLTAALKKKTGFGCRLKRILTLGLAHCG